MVRFALGLLDHVKTTRLSKEVGVVMWVWPPVMWLALYTCKYVCMGVCFRLKRRRNRIEIEWLRRKRNYNINRDKRYTKVYLTSPGPLEIGHNSFVSQHR